jgi:hypothetical protein
MRIVVESDVDALEHHVPAWDSLAAVAIDPNPFYEPWCFFLSRTHSRHDRSPMGGAANNPDGHSSCAQTIRGFNSVIDGPSQSLCASSYKHRTKRS